MNTPDDGGMNDRDAAGIELMHDAFARWADMGPVALSMARQDAWTVMLGLQAAVTHPNVGGGPLGSRMESVGRQIQEAVSDTPELYAVAEAGWNRAFDVDPAGTEERGTDA